MEKAGFISSSFQVEHLKAILAHRNKPQSTGEQQEHVSGKRIDGDKLFNFEELLTTRKVKMFKNCGDVSQRENCEKFIFKSR